MPIKAEEFLNATVKSLELLNTQDNPELVLSELVKILGIGTDVDRCYVFKTEYDESNAPLLSQICEYTKDHVSVQLDNPELQKVPYAAFPDLYESLLKGKPYFGLVEDHPNEVFREIMSSQDILSYIFAPIITDGFLWGWIGFDNCTQKHLWLQEEVNAIHTIAHSVAIRLQSFYLTLSNKKSLDRYLISTLSSDTGIWEWDILQDTLYYSKAALNMLGHDLNEGYFPMSFFWEHLLEEDYPLLTETINAVKNGGSTAFEIKYRFKKSNGEIIWVKTKAMARKENPTHFLGTNIDITTLINQENQINHQKIVLENLVEGSGYYAIIANENDEVVFINKKAQEVLGSAFLTSELKPDWSKIIHPDDWDKLWEFYYRQFQNKDTEEAYLRFIDPLTNSTNFFKVFSNNQIDNPLINGVIFFGIDISNEQALTKQLEEANYNLQGVLSNMDNMFFSVNIAKNSVRFTNNSALFIEKFGLTESDVENDATTILKLIVKNNNISEEILKYSRGKDRSFERTFETQINDKQAWYIIKLTRRNYSTNIIDGSFTDITATMILQRQHELELISSKRRYEQIANHIHDMVCILDLDGKIVFSSPASQEVLNYSPEEMSAFNFYNLIHFSSLKSFTNRINHISKSLQPEACEVQMTLKNGVVNWIEIYISPLTGNTGTIDSFQIAARNIEFRKRAEEENKIILEKEREFSELKAHFVSMASHQFRTPLSVLHSNAEYIDLLIDKNLLDESKLTKVSNTFKREINRLTELMENILIFGRMEKSLKVNLTSFKLKDFLVNILDNYFFEESKDRPIQEFNCIDLTITSDELLLSHVLVNIISNAYKYSPGKKAPEINATLDGDDLLVIRIKDFGIGIPQIEIDKVFESFYRASNTATFQGTGLGLVLCKQIMTTLEGNIEIRSTEGLGSEVTISLPVV